MDEQGPVRLWDLIPLELLKRGHREPGRLVKPLEQFSPRRHGTGAAASGQSGS